MKPKGKIAAVLALAPKKDDAPESSPDLGGAEEDTESSSVTVDAAQALKDAMSGSAEDIAKAFKDMLAVCME